MDLTVGWSYLAIDSILEGSTHCPFYFSFQVRKQKALMMTLSITIEAGCNSKDADVAPEYDTVQT